MVRAYGIWSTSCFHPPHSRFRMTEIPSQVSQPKHRDPSTPSFQLRLWFLPGRSRPSVFLISFSSTAPLPHHTATHYTAAKLQECATEKSGASLLGPVPTNKEEALPREQHANNSGVLITLSSAYSVWS